MKTGARQIAQAKPWKSRLITSGQIIVNWGSTGKPRYEKRSNPI